MDQGLLPRRYAKALYKFAAERGDQTAVYGLMQNIAASFTKVDGLQKTISNPFVADSVKEKLLTDAAGTTGADGNGAQAAGTLADFLKLLSKNHRMDIVRDTALAYCDIYRAANDIYKVTVTSAAPLDDKERSRLEGLIKARLGNGTAEMDYEVDPDLIGGFVVTVDNDRLDASVRNELRQLRQALLA